MSTGLFNLKKALNVFGCSPEQLQARGINESSLPAFARSLNDNRLLKSWSLEELPAVGEKIGFMKKPEAPLAIAVFVSKGGVLKSSLTLNLARLAALHGIRTCVVGLDMQGDVTTGLAGDFADDENSLEEAISRMNSLRGLADVFTGESKIEDVIRPTDIPTLAYIPETPELVALDQSLINRNRREYWLKENVINPLKERFDLILLDCSPNWNRLITNALIACDVLISPLECKINNFRNFKTFRALMTEFRDDMRADFTQVYVPTRLTSSRRLSVEIYEWYRANLPECTKVAVRESIQGEESVAMHLSIPEYAPTSAAADEMRELLSEIWNAIDAQGSMPADKNRVREPSPRPAELMA
jgi:chromosome partitioning protein